MNILIVFIYSLYIFLRISFAIMVAADIVIAKEVWAYKELHIANLSIISHVVITYYVLVIRIIYVPCRIH